jgi:predicted DNA-binding transcriptional regulator AlpA
MEQPMSVIKRVLRTRQAAEHVGLSASTLEKFRLRGNGPPYLKAGPKIVVYRVEDLDAWLDANRRRSTSDPGATTAAGGGHDDPVGGPGEEAHRSGDS